MRTGDFVKMVKELADSKNLDWTSFRERRMYEVGKNLENGRVDINQAIADIAMELKSYNVGRDDIRKLEEKLKK
jgi:hypothetical protein